MVLLPDMSTLLLPFRAAPDNAQPLRVGVVLDRIHPSPWTGALLSSLRQLPGIDVCVLTLSARLDSVSRRPSWLTERLYAASRARFDPFGDLKSDETGSAGRESLDEIKAAGCAILLWLARCTDPGIDPCGMVSHGAFTVRFGNKDRVIPFWDEVANSEVTSKVTVYWHESSFVRGRAVRTVETSTLAGLYVTQNAEEPLVATIRSLANLCLEFRDQGVRFEERLRRVPEDSVEVPASADCPAAFEAGRFVLSKLARSARLRWKARDTEARWVVAMRPNSGASITEPDRMDLSGFREVALPRGSEAMADPFLWESGGRTYLFFEELETGSSRGRLACVEVFPDGACSEMSIILDRPYHLSYPCVAPAGGDLFLMPESSKAARVDLYRFSRFPERLELVASPVEGMALVDTTPFFLNDRWYFFTTTSQPFLETLLFWSHRLDGAWSLHPSSPISCSVRNSRSAGNLFWRNGRLYRPTQDCSVRYGYAIQVNEVLRLTPAEFEERPVSQVPPAWRAGLLGTHTWNESSRLQALDGIRIVPRTGAKLPG